MNHCIECKHWNPRESGNLAKLGMAWCMTKHPLHTVRAYALACQKFEALDAEKVKARVVWLENQKAKL